MHLFLHPGAEDLQTVQESVPQRTIQAVIAARDDLMAGFTAERDMGTEGAGSADTAVRDAIDKGRSRSAPAHLRQCDRHSRRARGCQRFNPAQHVLSNATYANSVDELVAAIRQQHKEGADFVKIYRPGRIKCVNGVLQTPYQYSARAVEGCGRPRPTRLGGKVAVHAMGEPGTLYAAQAGVASIDHATQLSDATMKIMKERGIPAVPTFAIFEYFAQQPSARAAREKAQLDYKVQQFKKQLAAGIAFAVGSDVGPFPHGTQARELEPMVRYGMKPLAVLQADLINGARLLGWEGQIGQLRAGYYADIVAVQGSPLDDISVLEHVIFRDEVRGCLQAPGIKHCGFLRRCRALSRSRRAADPGSSCEHSESGNFGRLALGKADQLTGEVRVLARADRQNQSTGATARDIGMAHRAVQINSLPGGQPHSGIELEMNLDRAFEDVNELLSLVAQWRAELRDIVCPNPGQNRHHALLAQIGTQILVIVIRGADLDGIAAAGETATRRHDRHCRSRCGRICLGEKFRHREAQTGSELLELVVRQRKLVRFNLRKRGQRDANLLAHLPQRPGVALSQQANESAHGGLSAGHTGTISGKRSAALRPGTYCQTICLYQENRFS